MPTDPIKLVDTYAAFSRQLAEEYRARRALEWQMHLALWTILAGAVYLCVTKDIHLGRAALCVFFAVPLHFVWTIMIVRGEIREQKLSIYYRTCAVELLRGSADVPGVELPPAPTEESSTMPSSLARSFIPYCWWLFVQIGTTILFSAFAYALMQ